MSWKDVAEAFQTSEAKSFVRSNKLVGCGGQHMDLDGIAAIGIEKELCGLAETEKGRP